MSRVRIVTDSATTISPALAKQLDITILPLTISIGERKYRDGIDISAEELLLRMARDRVRPQVVGPTTEQFFDVYSRLTRETNQIISLHSSANLSPVHREAQAAARAFLGRCDIVVMDSETLSLGLDILVEEAARQSRAAVPLSDIVRHIRGMIHHIYVVMVTDTLDYLQHGHRITATQAVLGTMLDVKPFLSIEEGEIIPMEKVRSRERAIDKLVEFVSEFSAIEQMVILQNTPYATDETKLLQERLALAWPGRKFPVVLYGPLLACHIGPDAIGLVVYEGIAQEAAL